VTLPDGHFERIWDEHTKLTLDKLTNLSAIGVDENEQ
jgi:hypothetical protein